MADLQDKVAVVTGGSRGLGLVLARELGRAGCRVAICGRDPESLTWAQGRLSDYGVDVLAQRCDVAARTDVDEFLGKVRRELGPIDVLVNNAGVMDVGP